MGIEEIGSGTLPNVYISNIDVTENQSSITLKVKVSVKDSANDSERGYWRNTSVQDHANIDLLCVVSDLASSDSETNEARTNLIKDLNDGMIAPVNVDSGFRIIRRTIPLSSLHSPESHQDRFGFTVYDYYFEVESIEISRHLLSDVVLYASVYVDLGQLNSGDYDFAFIKNYVGYVRSEYVYKDGAPQMTTSYFINDNTGDIWPGPVHFHQGTGWMEGAEHTDLPHGSLRKVDIANPKIFFSFAEAMSPIIEQEELESGNQALSPITQQEELESGNQALSPITQQEYLPIAVSEPYYTFDIDETVGGVFMLDVRNILFNDTFEGSLVHEVAPSAFENLTNYVDISKMELVRDSVVDNQKFNELYTLVDPDEIMYGDNDRIVAITQNAPGDLLQDSQRYVIDNKISVNVDINKLPLSNPNVSFLDLENLSQEQLAGAIRTGGIQEIDSTMLNGVRMISFTDEHIKRLKGGEFAYTVKLTITNRISDYMIELFSSFKDAIELNRKTLLDSEREQNYDFVNNKFKNSYIDLMDETYGFTGDSISTNSSNAPWILGAYYYKEVYALISTNPVNIVSLINGLAPRTTNQETLSSNIRSMEDLLESALRRYNYTDSELYEGNFDSRASTANSINRKKIFTIEKTFKKTINTDNMDKMGYSFFDEQNKGIQKIKSSDFISRGETEFNKFYNSIPSKDVGINDISEEDKRSLRDVRNNLYSYLTPTEIKAGSERLKIDGSDRSFDISFANRLELKKGSNKAAKGPKRSFRSRSFRSGFKFGGPMQFKTSNKDDKYVKASDYVGTASPFLDRTLQQLSETETSSEFDEAQNTNILASIQSDKRRPSGRIPSIKTFQQIPKDNKQIRRLPLQIKSILLSKSNATKSNFGDYDIFADPNTRQASELNYTKIRQVEYLKEFGLKSGLNSLEDANWVLLDQEALLNIGDKRLICRLKPYINDYYDLSDDPDDIKDYNEIFIINGDIA